MPVLRLQARDDGHRGRGMTPVHSFLSPLAVVQNTAAVEASGADPTPDPSLGSAPSLSSMATAIVEQADGMSVLAGDARQPGITPLTFGRRDIPTGVFDELVLHFDLHVSRPSFGDYRMTLLNGALLYEATDDAAEERVA